MADYGEFTPIKVQARTTPMADDLVERLKARKGEAITRVEKLMDEALARILALEAKRDGLVKEVEGLVASRLAMKDRYRNAAVDATTRATTAEARIAELEEALRPWAVIAEAVLSEAPPDATKAKLWNGSDNLPLYISLDACRALTKAPS